MAPDNGLLAPILDACETPRVGRLDVDRLDLPPPSATFHGRDIFAPVAADLAAGRVGIDDIATITQEWTPGWVDDPQPGHGKVTGVVITIDNFGNLISNIAASLIEGFAQPVAAIAGHEIPMLSTYGRARPGEYLALVNSFGVVEVARAEGSAAEGLGADRGAPISVQDGHTT
mgnify:FL=1